MYRKNVFILGAGFSANAGAPVMRNFLDKARELRDDPRSNLSEEDRKTFGNVFQRLNELRVAQARMDVDLENIEHLFSLLDMDIEFGGITKSTLRQELIFLILRTLEKTIRPETLNAGWAALKMSEQGGPPIRQRSIWTNYVQLFCGLCSRRWIKGPFGVSKDSTCPDTIITMNYDCLVDDSLVRLGVQPAYAIKGSESPQEFKQLEHKVRLLKLHGSANWFICNSDICRDKVVVVGGTPGQRLEYFYGQHCPNCGQNAVQPLIVPPTWAKGGQSEILRSVWSEALRALREAGRIFIMGYSLPSSDEFFRYMLALALATNESVEKVIVVNRSDEARGTFEKLFHQQFRERRLIWKQATVEGYGHELGNELGQYAHGLDPDMISASGIQISQ